MRHSAGTVFYLLTKGSRHDQENNIPPTNLCYILDTKTTAVSYGLGSTDESKPFVDLSLCFKKAVSLASIAPTNRLDYDFMYTEMDERRDEVKRVYQQMDELNLDPAERRDVAGAYKNALGRGLAALAVYNVDDGQVRLTCPVTTVRAPGERTVWLGTLHADGFWNPVQWSPRQEQFQVHTLMNELALTPAERGGVMEAYKKTFGEGLPPLSDFAVFGASSPTIKPPGG